MYDLISSQEAEALLERVLAFRDQSEQPSPTDELSALMALFPRVSMRDGFMLDFVQDTTEAGVRQPIRPYARPIVDGDDWLPLFDAEPEREDLVEQLYQYLRYEASPEGLFEYAFFIIELWSLRLSRHAAEWLESKPIFTQSTFDGIVESANKVNDLRRPDHFGPLSRSLDGGGRVRFLVHTPMGWERIYYLESMVSADGFVEQEAGEIVADMGMGLVF
jgi:hypothetical protein